MPLVPPPRLSLSLLPASLRHWCRAWLLELPGAAQRRRALVAAGFALVAVLLRPWPPFRAMPGWCVAALLLWAVIEAALWQWRPRRWR
ncbi:MAG: hypothetical protein ACKOZT_11675 [Cyanobium sp.]